MSNDTSIGVPGAESHVKSDLAPEDDDAVVSVLCSTGVGWDTYRLEHDESMAIRDSDGNVLAQVVVDPGDEPSG